jgi:hypothetical protein
MIKISLPRCAAKAIFYCPSMNSHRPRSQNIPKDSTLNPEKDSSIKRPRSHVSLAKSLRSRENEAAQQFKYVEDLCAELELAVLVGNVREVKCQRRALTSGLQQAEEAIVRTAEAHRWTKAELDRALDDVRGHALSHKERADEFLQAEEQEKRGQWIHECQKMTQNAINLASQATRALTIGDWSRQDCEEFLDELEKEFKKVNKELDTYPLMDCEPGVKRKMADCHLRLEAARYEAERVVTRLLRDHDAWGQVSREGRPRENAPETRAELRSRRDEGDPAEKALPVRFESLRLERNSMGAGEPEEDRPRPSRGVQEERHTTSTPAGSDREQRRKRSPPLHRGERCLRAGPVPGGCIPAPRSPRRMNMTAIRGGARGGRRREDPALPDREGLTSGTAEKNGRGAEGIARETGSRTALAEQFPQGQADLGHRRERRHTLTRRGT